MQSQMTCRTRHRNTLAASLQPAEVRRTAGMRLRRAAMEAGVVLSLTLAIVAILCLFGFQHASALEMIGPAHHEGRIAMGAVLLGAFIGLCGLTSFMLRKTLSADDNHGACPRH